MSDDQIAALETKLASAHKLLHLAGKRIVELEALVETLRQLARSKPDREAVAKAILDDD